MLDLDQDERFEGVRVLAEVYGWTPEEAIGHLNRFFDPIRPRIAAGMINRAEMIALFREHHLRAEER